MHDYDDFVDRDASEGGPVWLTDEDHINMALGEQVDRLMEETGTPQTDDVARATIRCVLQDTPKDWDMVTAEDVFAWALSEVAS